MNQQLLDQLGCGQVEKQTKKRGDPRGDQKERRGWEEKGTIGGAMEGRDKYSKERMLGEMPSRNSEQRTWIGAKSKPQFPRREQRGRKGKVLRPFEIWW